MSYDPDKIEEWVVSSNGYWRKGEVNPHLWCVPFTGTWEQVKARQEEMMAMNKRHAAERDTLEKQQRTEQRTLWPRA